MNGLNKVLLIGRIGKDPEVKEFNSDKLVNMSLATSKSWKDNQGEKQERTEWHNLELWGGLANVAESYIKKGDLIYIEGEIKTTKSEKDGTTRYFTSIIVKELKMLGGNKSNEHESSNDELPF